MSMVTENADKSIQVYRIYSISAPGLRKGWGTIRE